MAYLYSLLTIFFICFSSSVFSQSVQVGSIDLAGWIKNTDGTYTKAFGDSKVTLNSPPQGIKTTSTATVNTSKGLVPFEISKTANVDVARVGKSVRGLAVLGGPLGMSVTAVSLVCELTTICNDAGQWLMGADPALEGYPSTLPSVGHYRVAGIEAYKYPSPSIGCSNAASKDKFWGEGYTGVGSGTGPSACAVTKTSTGITNYSSISFVSGTCPTSYTVSGSTCVLQGNSTPHAPTSADWDSKQSLLNDDRFIPELIDKAADVPVSGIPTLTAGQKKALGLESKPTTDSSGNVTGREDTSTEIEAVDAGTTDNPGLVIIKETQTTIKYDNNNTQISSTTNTSYSNQPEAIKPQGFEIKFDEIAPAAIETHNVPVSFNASSWGTGTCPPDIEVALSAFTFSLPLAPACTTAEMINPFVLAISSLIGVYIIAGVRGGSR